MTVLHARTVALGAAASRDVLRLWVRRQNGELAEARFVAASAVVLARANAQAVTVADLALTAALIHQSREMVVPLGLVPEPVEIDLDRIGGVVRGVLEADVASVSSVEELADSQRRRLVVTARAEPQTTVQNAMGRAMTEREVPGWTREVSAGACPLCRSLAGPVLPVSARMVRHAGCSCVPQPVFT